MTKPLAVLALFALVVALIASTKRLQADYYMARGNYVLAVKANPFSWRHRFAFAYELQDRGFDAAAAINYRIVLHLFPLNLDALNNLAVLHVKHGEIKQARRLYERILSMWPEHKEAKKNLEGLG